MLFLIFLALNLLLRQRETLDSLSNLDKSQSVIRLFVDNPSRSFLFKTERFVACSFSSPANPYSLPHYRCKLLAPALHIFSIILCETSHVNFGIGIPQNETTKSCKVSNLFSRRSQYSLGRRSSSSF